MTTSQKKSVGFWTEWPEGVRWSHEGMIRLLAFLLEGSRGNPDYIFRVVVPDWIRDVAEEDLRGIDAKIGVDFTIHSPRDHDVEATSFADLAQFANEWVPVDAWLSLYPYFKHAALLDAPLAVVFPDAIPKAFHEFSDAAWGEEGNHLRWEGDVRELLSHAGRIVTFSDHVAEKHARDIFGFDRKLADTVSHAAPDLESLLPVLRGRRRSTASRRVAAEYLRAQARAKGNNYLRDYPFEEVDFIAISTQDRVTKNIQLAARALISIVRERRLDLKMIMTSALHFGHYWTVLPSVIEDAKALVDIVPMPDLPRREHAALLHCAAIAVHPSIFEGGHAPFPFYEAVSVGTPALMAHGPHIAELARNEPAILDYCFDWDDRDALANMIIATLERREEVVAAQQEIYARLQKTSWADVAAGYARSALSAA